METDRVAASLLDYKETSYIAPVALTFIPERVTSHIPIDFYQTLHDNHLCFPFQDRFDLDALRIPILSTTERPYVWFFLKKVPMVNDIRFILPKVLRQKCVSPLGDIEDLLNLYPYGEPGFFTLDYGKIKIWFFYEGVGGEIFEAYFSWDYILHRWRIDDSRQNHSPFRFNVGNYILSPCYV